MRSCTIARSMRFPRSCAFALLFGVLAPSLQPLLALTTNAEHACADHVCECARRCPPKRSAGSACHAKSEGRPDCAMRGACRHDQAPATAVATSVYLAPGSVTALLTFATGPLVRATTAPALVGFSRIDPRPPRTA